MFPMCKIDSDRTELSTKADSARSAFASVCISRSESTFVESSSVVPERYSL